MAWTHLVAAGSSVAAGGLFLAVGILLLRRSPPASESRSALVALSAWWLGIAATTWANAGLVWAGAAGDVDAALAWRLVGIAAAGAAVWGIIAYLAYVHAGHGRASRPVAWAYGALVAGTLAYILSTEPVLVVGDWTVDLRTAATPASYAVDAVLTTAFLLPPVAAGFLFLRLRRRSVEPAQRRRIATVGVGIPFWVFLHLLARLSDADWWQFLTRVVLGVVVALAVAAAYASGPRPDGEAAQDFEARVRDLV